jgi:hypothetical protein
MTELSGSTYIHSAAVIKAIYVNSSHLSLRNFHNVPLGCRNIRKSKQKRYFKGDQCQNGKTRESCLTICEEERRYGKTNAAKSTIMWRLQEIITANDNRYKI